ncbi:MAG: hypothetical protein ABIK39_03195 [candidate division WOR-3 bacterium]
MSYLPKEKPEDKGLLARRKFFPRRRYQLPWRWTVWLLWAGIFFILLMVIKVLFS